jgi:hypothetical protein
MTTVTSTDAQERADLLETLSLHRSFLRHTVRGLTDEQARERTTVSELCLGGLVKHLTVVERNWSNFIVNGPGVLGQGDEESRERHAAGFRMLEGETLAGLLAAYDEAARHTDGLVASLASLDASQPLPPAPWFKPGSHWSARRALLHLLAETAQHAGHADIIRESLDGAKTMG